MKKEYKLKNYENMSDEEFNRLNDELNRKKRNGKGIRNCIIFVVVILIATIYFSDNDDKTKTTASTNTTTSTTTAKNNTTTKPTNTTTTTTTPKTETKKETEPIVYETELTDGYYTAGIDFPAGRYTVTAIAGSGNVSSTNMFNGGLNEIMGVEADDVKEFKNAKFNDGVRLKVANGVTIKIHSDNADATPLKKRVQPNTETVTLANGYFIAGEDFPAGVYDIIVVDGSGNVSSDNMFDGGINAALGIVDGAFSDLYQQEYKNIELPDGIELKVSGGVTVDLIPSK